ncbi:putative FMN-binding domain-domain-containing protein [Naematelia encephala]|uniref:Putative FMN-binding domain-domain-containing protein n=1 Tax=Naematelia encephala TaxID=71784 RepID=A0A1Y2AM80_9TREE|nr:putative FMN-binding domain-domain-containing protein [Naematelia encephala]
MYIRPVHAELDPPTLHAFVRTYPLGLFTTYCPHPTISSLQSTHIPFVLDTPTDGPTILRGHIARANPHCKALLAASELPEEVVVIFQAPVHSYVTPKFYTTTKPLNGRVVPTWNYAAVQVYGTLRLHHTGKEGADFLQSQIEALTDQQELKAGHEKPWKVKDAPDKYVDLLKKGIIGLEIQVSRIEGRFKMSQEMADGDWNGVVQGFKGLGTKEGDEMARFIQERGKDREGGSRKEKEESEAVQRSLAEEREAVEQEPAKA